MADLTSCYIHAPAGYLSHVTINMIRGLAAEGVRVYCNLRETDTLGSPSATYQGTASCFQFAEYPDDIGVALIDVTQGLGDAGRLNAYIQGRMAAVVNMSDGANFSNVHYAMSLLTFSAHCNRFARHAGRIFPLGCGITQEAIERSNQSRLDAKVLRVVNNFSPTFRQSIRDALALCLVEKLGRYLPVDGRRVWGEDYWNYMAESAAVLAYCGEFYSDLRILPYMRDHVIKGQREYEFDVFERDTVALRWDSYRYWEAAAFACAPIQLDFEKYGMELPVMPIPWVHYIPIDLAEVSSLPDRIAGLLRDDPQALNKIGQNARRWVLDHYSPQAVARYVLNVLRSEWP